MPHKKQHNPQRNKNIALLLVLLLVVALLYTIAVMRIEMLGKEIKAKEELKEIQKEAEL